MDDVTLKNLMAIKQHSEQTRDMLRVLETRISRIDMLEQQIRELDKTVNRLLVQVNSGRRTEK